ncbi:hypothetical protein HHK36_009093 [Tetracentron sinense]|uniref:Transmembrane protein 18 n=1 Tax=Tetracentron sinense TaxID=13715 RepID=A0A834ZCE3_TETSI|nr:hypothetical protein HHK36_009093 [Tetracentron sinense]
MNEHMDQMTDLIERFTAELRTGFQPAYENFLGFFHAIDWKEPWLVCLLLFHIALLLIIIISRKNINFQMCLFLLSCRREVELIKPTSESTLEQKSQYERLVSLKFDVYGSVGEHITKMFDMLAQLKGMDMKISEVTGVYLAERINSFLGNNWKSFASQNYFDPHGVFLSVVALSSELNILLFPFADKHPFLFMPTNDQTMGILSYGSGFKNDALESVCHQTRPIGLKYANPNRNKWVMLLLKNLDLLVDYTLQDPGSTGCAYIKGTSSALICLHTGYFNTKIYSEPQANGKGWATAGCAAAQMWWRLCHVTENFSAQSHVKVDAGFIVEPTPRLGDNATTPDVAHPFSR